MMLCFLSRWRCEHNKQHSLIKVTCSFFLQNQLSISTTTYKIMQIQTLSNLQSVEFVQKFISPNTPKLEHYIARVWVCFRNTFASTAGHFKECMSLPFMADIATFFFSAQFQKWKHFAHFVRLILLLTCKKIFQWQTFQAKKIHSKDRNSKLYFSKGIQNNLSRSNFHCSNATWENRKVRNIITRYIVMSIWVRTFLNITWNRWTSSQ